MRRLVAVLITVGAALVLGRWVEQSWGMGLQPAGLAGAAVLLAGGWALAGLVYVGFNRQPSAGFLAAVVVAVSVVNALALMLASGR